MRYRSRERNNHARYLSLGVFFVVCVLVFAVRLVYYQLVVSDQYASVVAGGSNVTTVTVQAQRGNICDRNGNVLVKNSYTYDLQIEYGALPETREAAYRSYLAVLELLDETGTPRAEELSPFEGSYPSYSWSSAALDPSSNIHKKLCHVLDVFYVQNPKFKINSVDQALVEVSAERLASYIAQNYDIVSVDKSGNESSDYTPEQIERLVSLRYDLAASDFGVLSPYVLAENIDQRLISAVLERHLEGITVSAEASRIYNYQNPEGGRYAAHILGTIGSITAEKGEYYTSQGYRLDAKVGRSGCELAFEKYLRGVDGTLAIVKDDDGSVIDTYWVKEPIAGKDVWLTIDINVQMSAEDSLAKRILEQSGVGGAVAATDPNTGEILALASAPELELNRAISAYEPGSTFKVGMALAALNEGLIESYTNMLTRGSYNGMKCSHYVSEGECCGNIGVEKALERSCNYFFAKLGDDMSIDVIKKYAEAYGFGQPTGIEIGLNASTPEAIGSISDELAYMAAIGQLNSATPLQISQYISMIANGGTRYSAHLLKSVREYGASAPYYSTPVTVLGELSPLGVTDEDIKTVLRGMYDVVYGEDASSYVRDAFASAKYTVAGKTGTAQRAGQRDNALFVAYAPYESPKISVTCFVEQGNTGGIAASVVRDVMDSYSDNVSSLYTTKG